MGIPSLDQTLEALVPDNFEEWFFGTAAIAGFIFLLREGVGLGCSLVLAPVAAVPIGWLLMLGYVLLMSIILLIACVLQAFAAMHAMLRRPSP